MKAAHRVRRLAEPPDPYRVKRLNFAVTYLCNSRCTMCNIWQFYRKPKGPE